VLPRLSPILPLGLVTCVNAEIAFLLDYDALF
jgi:hypothetical protein